MGINKNNYVYVGQTSLRVVLQTDVNFNTRIPDTCKIMYIKPDTTDEAEGEWSAQVLSGSEANGKIFVDFDDDTNFDETGVWRLWAHVTFSDGRFAEGKVVEQLVRSSGQIYRD